MHSSSTLSSSAEISSSKACSTGGRIWGVGSATIPSVIGLDADVFGTVVWELAAISANPNLSLASLISCFLVA